MHISSFIYRKMYSLSRLNSCRQQFTYQQFVRFVSALKKAAAEFDEGVMKNIEENNFKPKKHPGIMPHGPYPLPSEVKNAITKLLNDAPKKQLLTEAEKFKRYLIARHRPKDESQIVSLKASVKEEIEEQMCVKTEDLSEEELKRYNQLKESEIQKVIKQRLYNWRRLEFTEYSSLLYMTSRSAAEYAAVSTILSEISARASFIPKSIFDFGSGVGSVIWAVNNIWGKAIKEYYCVDSSAIMNDLMKSIINNYKNEDFSNKIFQRQFLPSSFDVSSDIVISAYSLMELPNSSARYNTITNLWGRTKKFLILIEMGTRAGFSLINEARGFLKSKRDNMQEAAHVFAPCPHNQHCPRTRTTNICYFEAPYSTFPHAPEKLKKELYSYIVFQKGGSENILGENWPRIVQPVLCRSGHTICRFCTSDGKLKEVIFTANKNGKIPYKCASYSSWGDLFPAKIRDIDTSVTTNEEERSI